VTELWATSQATANRTTLRPAPDDDRASPARPLGPAAAGSQRPSPSDDPACTTVAWSGSSSAPCAALAALGAGVELIACEHRPTDRTTAALHLGAIAATVGRPCGCKPQLAATGRRVAPGELFGWAYDRPTGRLLHNVDDTAWSWQPRRRGRNRPRPGYGPFASIAGQPEDGVWFDDLNDLEWGFACWLVPGGATDRDAQAIARLTVLIDQVLLARTGNDSEAFHCELHGGPNHSAVVGYDAWTVRTSPRRIVVIRAAASTSGADGTRTQR